VVRATSRAAEVGASRDPRRCARQDPSTYEKTDDAKIYKFRPLILRLGLGIKGGGVQRSAPALSPHVINDRRRCGWRPHPALDNSPFLSLSETLLGRWLTSTIALPGLYKVERVIITTNCLHEQDLKTTLDGFGGKAQLHNPAGSKGPAIPA